MSTLLERALEIKLGKRHGKGYSKEELDLVLAWLTDAVAFKQIQMVLKHKSS